MEVKRSKFTIGQWKCEIKEKKRSTGKIQVRFKIGKLFVV
jgi:hypothetical protein